MLSRLMPLYPDSSSSNPNHKDFAPRVGFAYRLTEKTVFRGGYGIYYNPNQTNSFTFLNTNPPFSPIVDLYVVPNTPTSRWRTPPVPPATGAARAAQRDHGQLEPAHARI